MHPSYPLSRRCAISLSILLIPALLHSLSSFLRVPISPPQFVGTELGTAHALSRHFNWASNILWPREEIQNLLSPHHTRIYLSEHDAILDASANRRYLRSFGMRDAAQGGGLTMAKGAAHGEVLMAGGKHMRDILDWLDAPDA